MADQHEDALQRAEEALARNGARGGKPHAMFATRAPAPVVDLAADVHAKLNALKLRAAELTAELAQEQSVRRQTLSAIGAAQLAYEEMAGQLTAASNALEVLADVVLQHDLSETRGDVERLFDVARASISAARKRLGNVPFPIRPVEGDPT